MRFIKPMSLSDKSFILDVRSEEEHQHEKLALPHVHQNLEELDPLEFIKQNQLSKDKTIYIICTSGARASQAAEMFEKAGFGNVAVVVGGIIEAEYEGLDVVRH